ncbi:MAG: SH3 domain-containing protein [Siculibacillus sp.]|nr:SH3 domain-containing protein [Siculibacillus sp.]
MLSLLLAAALLTTGSTLAAEIAPPATRCDFGAWSKDPDPAGLNVRAAPRRDAPVVGRLPPPRIVDGERLAVEFRVVGGAGPWLMIENAHHPDYGSPTRRVFTGRGWVAAGLVDVAPMDEKVRVGPTSDAAIVDEPRAVADRTYDFLVVGRILGCRGRWIEMEGDFRVDRTRRGRPVRGWVTDLCGNQVTTCN